MAGTSYYYEVAATSSVGDSGDSAPMAVTALAPAPSNLTATALTSTQVSLKWSDHSADEQGFKLEYYNGSAWTQFGTVTAGSTSVTVTGLPVPRATTDV